MKKKEVRVFKISGNAINELMWELLIKSGGLFLDLPEEEECVFHLKWFKEKDELIFYALEYQHPYPVDFDTIDLYIDKQIEMTADSLYSSNKKTYKSFVLDESIENMWNISDGSV